MGGDSVGDAVLSRRSIEEPPHRHTFPVLPTFGVFLPNGELETGEFVVSLNAFRKTDDSNSV